MKKDLSSEQIEKLRKFYLGLTSDERIKILERLKRMSLAIDINPDQEFINQTIEDFFKDYPQISIDELHDL